MLNIPFTENESGYVIRQWQIDNLVGRLLTLIESFGLRETQEKAVKDLVKQEVWNMNTPCFVIAGSDIQELIVKYEKDNPFQCGSAPKNKRK